MYSHVLLSVSSLQIRVLVVFISHCRNKHIMIDLGTGNNNKMYVFVVLDYAEYLINSVPRQKLGHRQQAGGVYAKLFGYRNS